MTEFPGREITGKPLMHWGLILVTIDAIANNIKQNRAVIQPEKVYVGPERPAEQAKYPAIIVELSGVEFRSEGVTGFHMNSMTGMGKLMYFSSGRVRLQVIGRTQEELWGLCGYLTNQYLGRLVHGNSYYNTMGDHVENIAVGFNPGVVPWSDKAWIPVPWNPGSPDQLATSTADIAFLGEHNYMFDFKNISHVEIEAIPKPPEADRAWLSVNTRV